MTVRRARLTDPNIEQLLLARSLEADRALVDQILAATEHLPQRPSWLPIPLDRRMLTLVTAALLLAALAGAIALAGRPVLPAPNPPPPGPEGGWIVYIDDGVMYRTELTGDPEPMLNEGLGPSTQCPAFSPDGRLFAYVEGENEREVIVASLDEAGIPHEALRIAAGSATCPKWSPDGRTVAFVGNDGLPWVASLDGEVRKLSLCRRGTTCNTRPPWPTIGASDLAWTHDGSALVVLGTSGREGEGHVVVLPLEDGEPRFVLDSTGDETTEEWLQYIVPSPAGPYIAVVAEWQEWLDDSSSRFQSGSLRVIDLDGVVVFEASTDYSLQRDTVAWSPDGSRLAWSHPDGIRIREIDPGGETTLLRLPAMPRAGTDVAMYWLAWSPDGQRFLLNVSTDTGGHAHAIVTIAADGSGDVVVHSPWTLSLEWSFGFSWQPMSGSAE